MKNLLTKKYAVTIIMLAIVIGAFAFRFYNFSDWLYFKMDQSRDAQLVSHAINEGPMMLPLLGPRAGATEVDSGFLRLGPAYYYFQYIAGAISNSTAPQVFAYPDLFFSILAIVLLYFLARIYFSKNISLLTMAMYAFSFIVIQYSRFAWNPNPLQFFALLTFFGLLKFLSEQKLKRKIGWLIIWVLGLSIGSQLHFFGFFVLTAISGCLILFHSQFWKLQKIKDIFQKNILQKIAIYSLVFISVFALIYSPVIISDVMRKGENAGNFIQALSSKAKDKSFAEKISKNFSENTKYYCLITTSFCGEGEPFDGTNNDLPSILTIILISSGIILSARALRREKDSSRRNFLALLFLWIGVFFIFTFPVSFQLRPRFFILVFAVPFLLSGVVFNFFQERWPKKSAYPISAVAIIIFSLNVYGTLAWFSEMKQSQIKDVEINRTLILKTKDGVTLSELQKVADFIYTKRKTGDTSYFYTKPEHINPIKYILAQKNDPNFVYETLSLNDNPNAQYFATIPSDTEPKKALEKKYGVPVEILSSQDCGQISVYEINFPERNISKNFRFNKKYSKTDRLFWKDVFGIKKQTIEEDEELTSDINMNE
ncbi:MAG: phospholipid carrier-dependent glycosyltransferase [bacterium]|nr:phospholipid carrier-dependent glycosyltransferase [bacterium]